MFAWITFPCLPELPCHVCMDYLVMFAWITFPSLPGLPCHVCLDYLVMFAWTTLSCLPIRFIKCFPHTLEIEIKVFPI